MLDVPRLKTVNLASRPGLWIFECARCEAKIGCNSLQVCFRKLKKMFVAMSVGYVSANLSDSSSGSWADEVWYSMLQ